MNDIVNSIRLSTNGRSNQGIICGQEIMRFKFNDQDMRSNEYRVILRRNITDGLGKCEKILGSWNERFPHGSLHAPQQPTYFIEALEKKLRLLLSYLDWYEGINKC